MRRARDALVADAPSPRKMGLRLIRDPVDVDPRRGDRRSQSHAGDEVPARIEQIQGLATDVYESPSGASCAVSLTLCVPRNALWPDPGSEEDVYPHRAARSRCFHVPCAGPRLSKLAVPTTEWPRV